MLLAIFGLTVLTWLTYWEGIQNGFVSDDIEGLQNYDGKPKKFDYPNINKFIFFKLFGKDPRANHFASILLHNTAVILLYLFLSNLIGERLALLTSILFAVHPMSSQAVAWISARGYPLGLSFCLLALNLVTLFPPQVLNLTQVVDVGRFAIFAGVFSILYWLAVEAQFTLLATFVILAFLGQWGLAGLGLGVTLFCGMNIVREVIGHRTATFKEQNLEISTKVHWKKVIVACKTLAYYTYICIFPKRLGLYHTFYYHYTDKTEKEDKWFWLGFIETMVLLIGFIYGGYVVKFAILWFVAYIWIFLNWITIHQFISERYAYIANIGLCILMAYLLQNHLILFAIVATVYLVRSWVHLPTYQNEVAFYQSNVWNFPNSEVAFANLGVIYVKIGLTGSALDMWQISANINPDYDVAFYNLHSVIRGRGDILKARELLSKAVNAKCCHFKEQWGKELAEIDREIAFAQEIDIVYKQLAELDKDPSKKPQADAARNELTRLMTIQKEMEENRKKNITLVLQDESTLKVKLVQIQQIKEQVSKPIPIDEILKVRRNNFAIIKQGVDSLIKEVKNADTSSGVQKG